MDHPLRNDSHVYEGANGGLHIVDIRKVDAGRYTCTAVNALGTDSSTIEVQVQVPPLVVMQPEVAPLKSSLLFNCLASGDQPLQVRWLKEGTPLDVSDPTKFIALPSQGTGSNRLLVTHTSDNDTGIYQCEAQNMYGTQQDVTYVYKDMQQVSCSDAFTICSARVCGAQCPGNCQHAAEPVVGTSHYSTQSSICKSAVHSGILGERQSATVVWTNDVNTSPFTALTAHGVQSGGGPTEPIAATPISLDSP